MGKPREWWIKLNASREAVDKPISNSVHVVEMSAVQPLIDALEGLLADTQHSDHRCGEDDLRCPVDIARDTLKEWRGE